MVRIDRRKPYHSLFDQEWQVMEYARHMHRNNVGGGGPWAHKILVRVSLDSLKICRERIKNQMACNISKPCLRINYIQRLKTYTYITSNVCKQAGFRAKSDRMWQFDILFITTKSSNAAVLISSGKQGRKFMQWQYGLQCCKTMNVYCQCRETNTPTNNVFATCIKTTVLHVSLPNTISIS